jgi:hypothetical protein
MDVVEAAIGTADHNGKAVHHGKEKGKWKHRGKGKVKVDHHGQAAAHLGANPTTLLQPLPHRMRLHHGARTFPTGAQMEVAQVSMEDE